MNLKQLFADEDAVSPVIGVILMVAITVILAAVIGTFVLGLGENVQDSAPQANFQFEYPSDDYAASDSSSEVIRITHTGGEDIDRSTLSVQVGSATFNQTSTTGTAEGVDTAWSDPVSTGSELELNDNDETSNDVSLDGSTVDFEADQNVRVIWTSPSGGTSNTIGQSTIPS